MISEMQQTCKACGRPDKFNFSVRDDIWERVVPEKLRSNVVCLSCFDDFAHRRGVNYAGALGERFYFVGSRGSFVFQPIQRSCHAAP